MKFLADHCVFGNTIRLLQSRGHEVITLRKLNQIGAEDAQVLSLAKSLDAILLTVDKGFGNIVSYPPEHHSGIVLLRINGMNQSRVHDILINFMKNQTQDSLNHALVVIDANTYRVRKADF